MKCEDLLQFSNFFWLCKTKQATLRHHHGLMGHVLSIFPYKRSFSGDKHRYSQP